MPDDQESPPVMGVCLTVGRGAPASWVTRFRRVLRRGEHHVRHDLGGLPWACAGITARQSGLLG